MVKRFLAAALVGSSLLAATISPALARSHRPVRVTPTQCILELHHLQHGNGELFNAADAAFAVQTPQADSYYVATFNGYAVACHMEGSWFRSLEHRRSPAEAAYIEALTD